MQIFKPGEIVGYKLQVDSPRPVPTPSAQFFCINPLKNYKDGATVANLSAFRNFLFEMDGPTIPTQKRQLEQLLQLPFAQCTHSAGKSLHYIVALEEDVGLESYREYWRFLKFMFAERRLKVDVSCSNPNRLSRTPGATRPSNGKEQKLKATGRVISVEEWEGWLYGGFNASFKYIYETFYLPKLEASKVSVVSGEVPSWIAGFDGGAVPEGQRHSMLLSIAVGLIKASIDEGQAEQIIVDRARRMCKDEGEALRVLSWARRNVEVD